MSGYYPYLLCGLPELGFEMNLESFSYEEIKQQSFELLQPSDRKMVKLFLSFPEHKELVQKYLKTEDADARKELAEGDAEMPAYQKRFFNTSLPCLLGLEEDEEPALQGEELEDALKNYLDCSFYEEVLKGGNAFMRKWYEFDLILRNTLVAFAARIQGRNAEEEFVYPLPERNEDEDRCEPEIIGWIKENTDKEDFGLKLRLSYAEDLFNALEIKDVYERERKVDLFRWRMADELTSGKDFQMDCVLSYMVKAAILDRWQKMDRDKGLKFLQETVGSLRKVEFRD